MKIVDKRTKKRTKLHIYKCKLCGKEFGSYRNGKKTCNCAGIAYKHGRARTPIHQVWCGIKGRCLNSNNPAYKNYGGRGIKICKSWLKFENFYKDMGIRPASKDSLDRIDNNGNYCKNNCKWATWEQQGNNKRNNLVYEGETASQASRRLKGSPNLVTNRINDLHWSARRAFTTPNLNNP